MRTSMKLALTALGTQGVGVVAWHPIWVVLSCISAGLIGAAISYRINGA